MDEAIPLVKILAIYGSIAMPFFNIPLILRIIRRGSSADLSLVWVLGVYACILLMFPYGVRADDMVLKAFSITNLVLFSVVVLVAIWYRIRNMNKTSCIQKMENRK